ncbi:MAG: dihydropteroate synthase [Lachnospiraceae bacterium]|nr:dihydropteroate synthase [Lachnospiraceae bacterium]
MQIGTRQFDTKNEVYMMGILNVTPDSFSDGGRFDRPEAALRQAEKMIQEGAHIIDVGGESTRPGYERVSTEEEIRRVVPVIEAIKKRWDIPISLDTYKTGVAEAGIGAGADLINDIWGLRSPENGDMAALIGEAGVSCILMHNTEKPLGDDVMGRIKEDLKLTLEIAQEAGIAKDRILLDPGIGFGKDTAQNRQVIATLEQLGELGYPMMLAASRKSVIGNTLDLPVDQRLEGTIALTVIGVMKGVSFFRVHDVKENLRAAKMALAIRNSI